MSCLWLARLPALLIAAAALCGAVRGQSLRAGAAQVRVTPDSPQPLAGCFHGRLSTGVHDELWAKALVLDDGETRAAIVACDVIRVPGEVARRARESILAATGIPPESVLVSATHTHTAPHVRGAFPGQLAERIAEAVAAAAARLEPARVQLAEGEEPSLVFNRRLFMADGTVGWNPGKRNPRIVRPAGPVDPRVSVITVDSASGATIATLINYALHLDTVGARS